MRDWADTIYNDCVADFAKKADRNRVFPLAIVPNSDPRSAAAEVRRCAKMGLRGGDLAFKRMGLPLWHHDWYVLWEAAAECRFPISFHSTGFKAARAPDTPEMEKEYAIEYRLVRSALFQTDTMEVLVSLLASGACEKYPPARPCSATRASSAAAYPPDPAPARIPPSPTGRNPPAAAGSAPARRRGTAAPGGSP
jgi:uncharacterized protein